MAMGACPRDEPQPKFSSATMMSPLCTFFGCGSSRGHAPIAIKAAGVDVVNAKSFARIFYRNSINTGLAIMECPEAVDAIKQGDVVDVDADAGVIANVTTGETFKAQPFPPFIREIIEEGGLINRTRKVLGIE